MIDKSIIERLFRCNYSKMYTLARAILHDDEESKDVVQDVFARLIDLNMIPDKEEAFLLTCVRNKCFDILAHKQTREKVEKLIILENGYEIYTCFDERPNFEELSQFVDNSLTDPTKTIFRLRFAENMKYNEISARMKLSEKTVYKHLKIALSKLKLHFNAKEN